jgi:hypothetical protein
LTPADAAPSKGEKELRRGLTGGLGGPGRPSTKAAWGGGGGEGDKMQPPSGRARSETINPADKPQPLGRPYKGAHIPERTGRCTREAVWAACDVFWLFDPCYTGEITRSGPANGYIHALSAPPTVTKLRMLRKSALEVDSEQARSP